VNPLLYDSYCNLCPKPTRLGNDAKDEEAILDESHFGYIY